VKVLGGVGGAGLVTRIVRGYTFVSRNYAANDRIFITGFSRGAYTARALAGLITSRGVLDATNTDLTDKEAAYRLGAAEWFEYRRKTLQKKRNLLDRLQEVAFDLPGFLTKAPTAPKIADVQIEAVAVWDTVGSLGIPSFNLQTDKKMDAFQFADLTLSSKVKHGFHAIGIDEQRDNFTPTLWDPDPRIIQVLFPGAHSDVGGGYQESGLSDGALSWVTDELTKLGVLFAAMPAFAWAPDPCGPSHKPWAEPPWSFLPSAPRTFPAGLCVHRSLRDRLVGGPGLVSAGQSPYDPMNLMGYVVARDVKAGITII